MLQDAKQLLLPLQGQHQVWKGLPVLARANLPQQPPDLLAASPQGELEQLPEEVFLGLLFLLWSTSLAGHTTALPCTLQ